VGRPDAADADEVADVVMACPTGALQFKRTDDGPDVPMPDGNVVTVVPGGPLYLRGDVELVDIEDETLLSDTRVALCRCGATGNGPLCDGSHEESAFDADGRSRPSSTRSSRPTAPCGFGSGRTGRSSSTGTSRWGAGTVNRSLGATTPLSVGAEPPG
jgi:CDGSH-type Zn-finger protein